jgi:hypothetical protein
MAIRGNGAADGTSACVSCTSTPARGPSFRRLQFASAGGAARRDVPTPPSAPPPHDDSGHGKYQREHADQEHDLVHMARARRDVDLIRLDPKLLNPLRINSNQRALGDELRWTGLRRPPAILVHADA